MMYHVVTFTLAARKGRGTDDTQQPSGTAAICPGARHAARSHDGIVKPISVSADMWRQIAQDIARGLPSGALDPDTATSRVLAAGEPVDVCWSGTWRIEASDPAELAEQVERRLAAGIGGQGRAS